MHVVIESDIEEDVADFESATESSGLQTITKASYMKIFTVQEANALLPNVRNMLAKIQHAHKNVLRYSDEAKKAADAAEQGGGGMVTASSTRNC